LSERKNKVLPLFDYFLTNQAKIRPQRIFSATFVFFGRNFGPLATLKRTRIREGLGARARRKNPWAWCAH
jgi:hypothetical protein